MSRSPTPFLELDGLFDDTNVDWATSPTALDSFEPATGGEEPSNSSMGDLGEPQQLPAHNSMPRSQAPNFTNIFDDDDGDEELDGLLFEPAGSDTVRLTPLLTANPVFRSSIPAVESPSIIDRSRSPEIPKIEALLDLLVGDTTTQDAQAPTLSTTSAAAQNSTDFSTEERAFMLAALEGVEATPPPSFQVAAESTRPTPRQASLMATGSYQEPVPDEKRKWKKIETGKDNWIVWNNTQPNAGQLYIDTDGSYLCCLRRQLQFLLTNQDALGKLTTFGSYKRSRRLQAIKLNGSTARPVSKRLAKKVSDPSIFSLKRPKTVAQNQHDTPPTGYSDPAINSRTMRK